MHFQDKLFTLIQKIENRKTQFTYWILFVYLVSLLRALMDGYLGTTHRFPNPVHLFLQVPFWNLNFLLAITIILHLATKEKIHKTTKAVIAFSLIFLLVPIIDFAVSGGEGIMLEYAMNPSEALSTLIPFSENSVITPGQGIAGLLAITTAIFYIIKKGQSPAKGLIAGIAIYLAGIFLGVYPAFLTSALGLEQHFTPAVALHCYFFLIVFALVQCLIVLWFHNRQEAESLLEHLHPLRFTHYLLLAALGAISALFFYPAVQLNSFALTASLSAVFLAFQASLAFNNFADKEIPKGVKEKDYSKIGIALLVFSQALAFLAGLKVLKEKERFVAECIVDV